MRKQVIDRFQVKDDCGKRSVIIKYKTFEESAEIRSDRMSANPITNELFETLEGGDVEQIDENSFQILGTSKIVRKI
ncbi:MAG: hypothetical protein JWQ02_3932 [Capsulimonas sp.]|nr:hypothetical protein [Capsulimonas sp.]